jgi:hypothetical protein
MDIGGFVEILILSALQLRRFYIYNNMLTMISGWRTFGMHFVPIGFIYMKYSYIALTLSVHILQLLYFQKTLRKQGYNLDP